MDTSVVFTFVAVEDASGGFSVCRLNGMRKVETFLCESKDEARARAREMADEVAKTMGARVVPGEVPTKHMAQFREHVLGRMSVLATPLVVRF